MQLDSFKLATKKGNTLLWIYNINHKYQNISFIDDESWNKSIIANWHMTINNHDNAYFTFLKICFIDTYPFAKSFVLKT